MAPAGPWNSDRALGSKSTGAELAGGNGLLDIEQRGESCVEEVLIDATVRMA